MNTADVTPEGRSLVTDSDLIGKGRTVREKVPISCYSLVFLAIEAEGRVCYEV